MSSMWQPAGVLSVLTRSWREERPLEQSESKERSGAVWRYVYALKRTNRIDATAVVTRMLSALRWETPPYLEGYNRYTSTSHKLTKWTTIEFEWEYFFSLVTIWERVSIPALINVTEEIQGDVKIVQTFSFGFALGFPLGLQSHQLRAGSKLLQEKGRRFKITKGGVDLINVKVWSRPLEKQTPKFHFLIKAIVVFFSFLMSANYNTRRFPPQNPIPVKVKQKLSNV